MAGGFGTRLRPITEGIPKPCIPVAGEPCILRIVRQLVQAGITEIGVTLMYLGERIREVLDQVDFPGVRFRYFEEAVPLGTAGSVKNCTPFLNDDFIVVSGDCVFDFDLLPAISFHRSHGSLLTIVSARTEDPRDFGIMLADASGRISRFLEKPDWSQAYSDEVNTGIYLCSRELLDLIPDGVSDFSKQVFPRLMKESIPIFRYSAPGYWCDIGTIGSYLDCNQRLLEKSGTVLESALDSETVLEHPCRIGKNVRLKNCRIGPGCVIGDGCDLENARISGSVIGNNVRIESGASVRNGILCDNTVLKRNVQIGDECVIGADCEIGASTTVAAGVRIYPENSIPERSRVSGNVHHKLRDFMPEDGKILFPFGEDFNGAFFFEIGRVLADLFSGDLLVGRAEQNDTSASMTFCGGVLARGKNIYDCGVSDLAQFRFSVRNYAFRGGVFFQRNYSNLILRIYDENGMPIASSVARALSSKLKDETACGGEEGVYRIFRGGSKSYLTFLKTFSRPERLMLKTVPSPVLAPLLPGFSVKRASERMKVYPEWVRIEREDGEPFDENLVQLAAFVSLGRTVNPVFFPYDYPSVCESAAEQFGFRCMRIDGTSPYARKLYPLTDPNVQALLILDLLSRENCGFGEFISRLPSFAVKQREVSVNVGCACIMRQLSASGGELLNGIRFQDRNGSVRILPRTRGNGFRICTEAANAETAEELCEFYTMKLKGLKPD